MDPPRQYYIPKMVPKKQNIFLHKTKHYQIQSHNTRRILQKPTKQTISGNHFQTLSPHTTQR